ncbi:hypothetical protein D3C72_1693090 [compost metagenome]
MLAQQRAQPVGDAVFEILRIVVRKQVAVQVAVAAAHALGVSKRVGDGHERDAAGHDGKGAAVEFSHHAVDALGAAGFIAVYGAGDDQARTAALARVVDGLEVECAAHAGHILCCCGKGKRGRHILAGFATGSRKNVRIVGPGMA